MKCRNEMFSINLVYIQTLKLATLQRATDWLKHKNTKLSEQLSQTNKSKHSNPQ
ncbi:hypothetical protein KFK09_008391 [Dendrobium nobile]|uniref:Uncharacterized protein n=1 Tax=Dendrobium nobile TaxID=94219 RepID=A0A8T3BK09_DENNO|nr:hypothetical protein KFK09_008391 [Dendrobium nobile]